MPLPFLLGAAAAAGAALVGAVGHMEAKETNERAEKMLEEAQELFKNAQRDLRRVQKETEESLIELGYNKKEVLETSIFLFLEVYQRIKDIEISNSIGLDEIQNFSIKNNETLELREMTDIYSNTLSAGATGAATGTIIALAATGTLPVVTGSLAAAGSLALAGNVGAAASLATSALTLTPLAAVAAPVLLFTGISSSIKADENLEKARASYYEAEAAVEKMETSKTVCNAIIKRTEMFGSLLNELNSMFLPCTQLLERVTRKKMGFFNKKINKNNLTEDEIKLIAITRSLAGAVKAVIDTPILTEKGNMSEKADNVYREISGKLPDFSNAVTQINQCEFKQAKPKQIKFTNEKATNKNNISKKFISLLIFASIIIAGIFYFSKNDNSSISNSFSKIGSQINEIKKDKQNSTINEDEKSKTDFETEFKFEEERSQNPNKYQGTERNQFIILNGEEVYIDEDGNILRD